MKKSAFGHVEIHSGEKVHVCSVEQAEENARDLIQEIESDAGKDPDDPFGVSFMVLWTAAKGVDDNCDTGAMTALANMYHALKARYRHIQELSVESKTAWHDHVGRRALIMRRDHADLSPHAIAKAIRKEKFPKGIKKRKPGTMYAYVLKVLESPKKDSN